MQYTHPHVRKTRTKSRGFTLIEVMYSLATFQFGMLGLLAVHQVGANGAQRNLDLTMATQLCKSTLELRHVMDNQVVPAPAYYNRYGVSTTSDQAYFTVTWQDDAPPQDNFHDLAVTVTWMLPSEKATADWPGHTVSMRTKISK